ncbi:hypothetical protein D3C76_1200800 [compost metagenome]
MLVIGVRLPLIVQLYATFTNHCGLDVHARWVDGTKARDRVTTDLCIVAVPILVTTEVQQLDQVDRRDVITVQVGRHVVDVEEHLKRVVRAFVDEGQIVTFDLYRTCPHLSHLVAVNHAGQTVTGRPLIS